MLRAFNVELLYAPEVEARCADYERLTESLIVILNAQQSHVPSLLNCGDNHTGQAIANAIDDHICGAQMHADWFDPRTLRRFYFELRLHANQLALERKAEEKARKQARLGERVELEPPRTMLSWVRGLPMSATVTDQISEGLMSVRSGNDVWYGVVSRTDDERGEIETTKYAARFAAPGHLFLK